MALKASKGPSAALAATAAVRAVTATVQLPNAVAEATTDVERLATATMAPLAQSPETKGSRAPEFFSIADRDDDSPPTSPSNFNTLPLASGTTSPFDEGISEGNVLEKLINKGGLTEKELHDFEEIQASFDQFRARQTEVERSVNDLLQRLNKRIQVPSSVASSECESDVESLGRTEDGLSFLDSCLGSRPGTPTGNSPLGSPRDRISLLGFQMPSMPPSFPGPASGSSDGRSEAREARRLDGTNPRGSESGDLRPKRATQTSTVPVISRLDKEASRVQEPDFGLRRVDEQPRQEDSLASTVEAESRCHASEEAVAALAESSREEVKAAQIPVERTVSGEEAVAALAESSREEVKVAQMPVERTVSGEEELEDAGLEEAWSPLEKSQEATVEEVGHSMLEQRPSASHITATEHERLPQFGSPGLCDEDQTNEAPATDPEVEPPDLANWYGWTVVATAEGRLFFFHEARQVSQWHQPRELNNILGVWTEARDETEAGTNVTFWRNDLLRISLWKDPRDTSNIFQAAMDGNLFFLQLYSQVNGDLDCTDHRRCSALHYACAGGSAPSTLFLLQQRAMVDRRDVASTTPLMLTCRYGYAGVLKVLLDAQANPSIADHQGQAPVHQAAELGQLDCLHLLLLCGAQAEQRNSMGETALDIAQRRRHLHCMTLLRRHDQLSGHRPAPPQRVYQVPEVTPKDKADGLTHWAMGPEVESAPWVSAYQEVAANDLIGFPERSPAVIEGESSSDTSDQYTEAADTPRQYRPEAGLLDALRRRFFPIRADLGLPNSFRYNKATQQWELSTSSAEAEGYERSRC